MLTISARKAPLRQHCSDSSLCTRGRLVVSRASKGFGPPPPPQKQGGPRKKQRPRGEELKVPDVLKPKQEAEDVLHKALGACSVVFLGDNGELNKLAAQKFSGIARYTPLDTAMLIEEASGKTMATIEAEEGRDAVVISEASVIEQLAVMLRCSIGTMGGGWGAAARSACWRHMYGAFTVWIDTAPEDTEEDAPQRGAYSGAEVRVVLKDDERDGGGSGDLDEVAESVVAQAVPALMGLLEKDDQLPKGKLLYVKLGCRGDWPDIQPPEWQPPDVSPPVNPVEGIPV